MPPQDDASGSEGEPKPLLPELKFFDLPEDQVRELQQILEAETGHPWRPLDARFAGIELLDLTAMLLDPVGWSYWRKHPPLVVPVPEESPPAPPPTPQPFPIKLDADHDAQLRRELRILEDELRWVQRRPSSWRWVTVALYNSLGHALAKHRPADYRDDPGLGQLLRLFDAVAKPRPEIQPHRAAVQEVERLRCTWITRAVREWPAATGELSRVFWTAAKVIVLLETTRSVEITRVLVSLQAKASRG